MDKNLRDLLDFDPIGTVEDKLGVPIDAKTTDPKVIGTGMAVAFLHSELKRRNLKERNDTYMSMPLIDFMSIVIDEGFKCIYEEEFIDDQWERQSRRERFAIYWHDDGILLNFESYDGQKHINSGKIHYNWRPLILDVAHRLHLYSSGGYHDYDNDPVWIGDHDIREAMRFNINNFRTYGNFVVPWVETPFLWFLNYMETKPEGYNYDEINIRKLAKIDPEIRAKFIVPNCKYYKELI